MQPDQVYRRREQIYDRLLAKQQRTAERLSNYRLTSVVVGLIASVLVYRAYRPWLGLALGALTLILFAYLALRHQRLRGRLRYTQLLSTINGKGSERISGRWPAFTDSGAEFRDDDHPYASDLDLFGQGSLFQWISSAQTPMGRQSLAKLLKEPPGAPAETAARQEAVAELAGELTWRQRLESEGMLVREKLEPAAPLLQWAEESHPEYLKPWLRVGIWVTPVLTILTVVLYALHLSPWQMPVLLLIGQGLLLRLYGKERSRLLSTVYRFEPSLRTYALMLARFENQRFEAEWLKARQGKLRDAQGRSAYDQIDRLSRMADRISNRENAYFLLINLLTLWDYHCMVALETWKQETGRSLRTWLEVLGEIEALSSLANVRYEHPDWAMPTVADTRVGLAARRLGHPLITQNCVANDFELKEPAGITVITGSNMSGKSTFLRTVGINLVLAYAGAPVCAEEFRCSVISLWTSMRVSDNLEHSISSFYAELLRIKRIVEAAKGSTRVCFLLDEIFKGTNSHDRHTGAKALITQLQKDGAYGLISTHDLELGDLERESGGRVTNYHFREEYEGGEIRFDYTLRRGVSTTRNALYLIKMVGIDLEAER